MMASHSRELWHIAVKGGGIGCCEHGEMAVAREKIGWRAKGVAGVRLQREAVVVMCRNGNGSAGGRVLDYFKP